MLRLTFADMLFTGDGEAFNVRCVVEDCAVFEVNVVTRLGNFLKTYRLTPGQVWASDFA